MRIIKTIIVIALLILACAIGNDLLNDGMISHKASCNDNEQIVNADAVDINSADFETLCTVKYIGDKTASNIIGYRETYGDFVNIEQIKNIDGISDDIFDAIKYEIRVGE